MTTCASCGVETPVGARFCPSCGVALAEAAPPEEMLKLVTVLFADVVSSTARAERMHPEDTRALMTEYFAAMAEEIEAEGGTVEKFIGDAIMAVFGAPTAHEDDALRAVRAARRMLDRLRSWNEGRGPGEQLELRVGINTGEAIASGVREADLLVTGDAVNVAARLEQAAQPGTIVIGERTARGVAGHFDLRELEPLALKGKAEAVAGLRRRGRAGGTGAARPAGGVGAARRPRDRARAPADHVRARACRGPSAARHADRRRRRRQEPPRPRVPRDARSETGVHVGRCLPYGEGITLRPLAEILKAEARHPRHRPDRSRAREARAARRA